MGTFILFHITSLQLQSRHDSDNAAAASVLTCGPLTGSE